MKKKRRRSLRYHGDRRPREWGERVPGGRGEAAEMGLRRLAAGWECEGGGEARVAGRPWGLPY